MKTYRLVLWCLIPYVIACAVAAPPRNGGALRVGGGFNHWDASAFPIPVRISVEETLEIRAGLLLAIQRWNHDAEVPIFSYEEVEPGSRDLSYPVHTLGTVVVVRAAVRRSPIDPTIAINERVYRGYGTIIASRIRLDHTTGPQSITEIFTHELGHALGLAHDVGDPGSIMYPIISTQRESFYIQDEDLRLIRIQMGILDTP